MADMQHNGKQIDLTSRTVLFTLEFGRFGNTRKANVEANTTANQDRFIHNKRLLNSPELAEIIKQDAALRSWLDKPNRCWKYGGRSGTMRVLSNDQVEEVFDRCHKYEHEERPILVKAFGDAYLAQVAEAQKDLGPEFDASQYPPVAEVLACFEMYWTFPSYATDEKLKVISPKVYALKTEEAQGKLTIAVEEIQQGMRALLKDYVDKLLGVLQPTDGKKKKLHKSAITKLQDFLNTFNLRNVTDDAQLQVEVDKLKLIMSGVDAGKIKESDNLKVDLTAKFAEASTSLTNLVEVTGRKFRS
jgi:hypothetical protein